MSMVHNNFRFLKLATISLFAVILIVGCTNQAYNINNPDSRDEIGKQLNENLLDNTNERSRRQYGIPRLTPGEVQGTYIGAHDVGHSSLDLVDEYEENTLDKISPESSAASDPIVTPDHCYYTATRNVNCRASDYVESSLIAILMQGEVAKLLFLNSTFTHGRFEIAPLQQCWIALGLMQDPADPVKMCEVSVVDAPPPIESSDLGGSDSPVCSSDLGENDCLAAGGNCVSGATGANCVC